MIQFRGGRLTVTITTPFMRGKSILCIACEKQDTRASPLLLAKKYIVRGGMWFTESVLA
jgi:hypothetical protein